MTAIEGGEASFLFFPGNISIHTRAKPGVAVGQEFKAVVRHPLNGPCQEPHITIIEPVATSP
ncbi:hypothetical protein QQM79_09300 [Marinobacteraceae bacterium S3BR75-40.1]